MTGGRAIAQKFVEARKTGETIDQYPGPIPHSLSDAYAIQDEAIALWAEPPRGWKVGRIGAPYDAELGARRLAGPIFRVAEDGADIPVFANGFAAVEAELVLRIGEALLPPATPLDDDVLRGLIDAAFIGIEVAGSPFRAINAMGPTVTISDFGNNQALVLGPRIADWEEPAVADWPVALAIDGTSVGAATIAAIPGGPIAAARFLLQTLGARGRAVAAGTLISTGAVTGVHPVHPGQSAVATFGEGRRVSCSISAL